MLVRGKRKRGEIVVVVRVVVRVGVRVSCGEGEGEMSWERIRGRVGRC